MPGSRGKRRIGIAALGAACLAGLAGFAAPSLASGVAGSPHDLSGRGTRAGFSICAYCHTPNNGGGVDVGQWTSLGPGPEGFPLFGIRAEDTPTRNETMPPPRGVSLVCLSCHDGVTAWDALYFNSRVTTASDRHAAGLRLWGANPDHPVSIDYPPAYESTMRLGSWRRAGRMPLFSTFGTNAQTGRVECASCHNPHNGALGKFLRASTRGSGLCYNCHIK